MLSLPSDLIAEKDKNRAIKNMKRTVEKSTLRDLDYTFLKGSGQEFQVELSASVIKDYSGNSTGFVVIMKDVTERRRMEEELRINTMHLSEWVEQMTWESVEAKR